MPLIPLLSGVLALSLQLPGTPSLFFLAYILVFLPWAAFRSAQRIRAARDGNAAKPLPSREGVWMGVTLSQAVLFALAWFTGRGFGYEIFALPPLGPREILAALGALAACFGLRSVLRAIRSEDERRQLTVYRLAPRSPREWLLWVASVLAASVAEEAAYRGVGMSILWYSLGTPWIAALLCATAFSLIHWTQGWKSKVTIFAITLVMHGLVGFTGTLILAMLVHAIYDLAAGYRIAREAQALGHEPR